MKELYILKGVFFQIKRIKEKGNYEGEKNLDKWYFNCQITQAESNQKEEKEEIGKHHITLNHEEGENTRTQEC